MDEFTTALDRRYDTTPDDRFEVLKCEICGLERTLIGDADLDEFYPSTYTPHSHQSASQSGLQRVYGRFLSTIDQAVGFDDLSEFVNQIAESGTVLDVGCGSGELLADLDELGYDVTGCDVSSDAARVAADRGYDIDIGRLPDCSYPDDAFDVVCFEHSFEHVADPIGYRQEVHRILRPNGSVVIEVPNPASIAARVFGEYWCEREVPRHVFNWPPEALQSFFEAGGFRTDEIEHSGSPRALRNSLRYWLADRGIDTPRVDLLDPVLMWPTALTAIVNGGERYRVAFSATE
ncbi:SAM-dependent methyltransferase [Halapricum desulfuricans]|uniref:SAM-dependent methyltransferase n=2 Tax=Halapricum desulfuricans TaxID=2841257 RepID=A0A897N6P6_9EURY|nr:SAM-dependent methyltransferase [Halapricum desulfuricans]